MLESLLARIGVPLLTRLLGRVLADFEDPLGRRAAGILDELDQALRAGQIPQSDIEKANRHMEVMARMESDEIRARLAEANRSLRAEIASQDAYVRRMRPTFGYLMAITWAAQMFGIAYIIVFEPTKAGEIIGAMASLSAIWGIGLSVLGIYVYKRSDDKKLKEHIFWNKNR